MTLASLAFVSVKKSCSSDYFEKKQIVAEANARAEEAARLE